VEGYLPASRAESRSERYDGCVNAHSSPIIIAMAKIKPMFKTSSPGYKRMGKKYQDDIRHIFNEESERALQDVRDRSYRGVSGDLANSWQRRTRVFGFEITSTDPAARWKIAGRGPGKMPPLAKIKAWALSKGLAPYAVAKRIAERGTERWRTEKNILNMSREGKLRKPNLFEDARLRITRRVSQLKFDK